jgi:hypothetical protein
MEEIVMEQLANKVMTNVQKVAYAIDGLTKGISREILADDLGYRNYKCMDIFLNRNGYKWNKQKQNYGAQEPMKSTKIALVPQGKTDQVIRFIAAGKDIKETAVLTGFGEVQSLATFMLAKGHAWDDETGNYAKRTDVEDDSAIDVEAFLEDATETIHTVPIGTDTGLALSLEEQFLLKQALPLLQQLLENKDTLEELMNCREVDEEAALPRFNIPGTYMTKCVHMTDLMGQLVKDYSVQNNVTQKNLFEVALVEFFRKHGYVREINTLLGV